MFLLLLTITKTWGEIRKSIFNNPYLKALWDSLKKSKKWLLAYWALFLSSTILFFIFKVMSCHPLLLLRVCWNYWKSDYIGKFSSWLTTLFRRQMLAWFFDWLKAFIFLHFYLKWISFIKNTKYRKMINELISINNKADTKKYA